MGKPISIDAVKKVSYYAEYKPTEASALVELQGDYPHLRQYKEFTPR